MAARRGRLAAVLPPVVLVGFTLALVGGFGWEVYRAATDPPGVDAVTYLRWAEALNHGYGLGLQPGADFAPDYWPPGGFYFLAWVLRGLGGSWRVYAVVGPILAAAAIVLLYYLAIACVGRRLAAPVCVGLACWGGFLINAVSIGSDFLGMALFLGALLVLVRAVGRSSLPTAGVAGVLFGLASLARPNDLLFTAFLAGLLALGRRRHSGFRRELTCVGIALLCSSLTVAPWIARNVRVTGRYSPVASSGATNFIIGNNPFATGTYYIWTPQQETTMLQMGLGGRNPYTRIGHIGWRPVLIYNLTHPGFALRNLGRKLYYLLFDEEITPDPLFLYTGTTFSLVAHAVFWILVVLGALRFWRRSEFAAMAIVAWLAYGVLSLLPFFGAPRFRLGFAPAAFILLLAGLEVLFGPGGSLLRRDPAPCREGAAGRVRERALSLE